MKNNFFTFLICFLCLTNLCRSEEATCGGIYNGCVNELNNVYDKAIEIAKSQNDGVSIISQSNQALAKINSSISDLKSKTGCDGYALQLENMKKKYSELIIIYTKSIDTDDFRDNGIAKAICYAIDLVTGNYGKAIMSLFIILVGMSFLSGHSEAVSFKYLICIALALALIFGSAQLADLISGNKYSCKMVNKK